MRHRPIDTLVVVFFCFTGWVCSDPLNAVADVAFVDETNEAGSVELFSDGEESSGDLPVGQTIEVSSLGTIDLHIKDQELSTVLQLLSIQSQRNIVASRNVAGTVTADLYGVDFYDALDAILTPNGFGYREKGQFIYVYTAAELDAMEEAERETVTRVYRLNYITAEDAAAFVAPLISGGGQIVASARSGSGFEPSMGDGGANEYAHAETLVIRDYPEEMEQIVAILKDVDIRPDQVLVEATILDAKLSEINEFGTDISILLNYNFGNFLSPLNVVDAILGGEVQDSSSGSTLTVPLQRALGNGGGINTGVGNTNTPGGFKIGVVSNNVSAFVRALDEVTDTTVVAKPKLLVLNRQRANLLVGGKLGYLSTTQTESAATQTVEFIDIGTQLTLRPFVSQDGFIRLELKPSITDGQTSVTSSGVVIPNTTNQELTTNVIVKSGQTVVLGGLFRESTKVDRAQVPFLGDIPLLGSAFKRQADDVDRSEVIFLIRPSIVKDETLYAQGEDMSRTADVMRLGAREGLLPWSRTKLTSAHLRQAQIELDKGKEDMALWSINMALALDPTALEAIRMKKDITGKSQFYWIDESVMERHLDDMVDTKLDNQDAESNIETMTEDEAVKELEEENAIPEPTEAVSSNQSTVPVDIGYLEEAFIPAPTSANWESDVNTSNQAADGTLSGRLESGALLEADNEPVDTNAAYSQEEMYQTAEVNTEYESESE